MIRVGVPRRFQDCALCDLDWPPTETFDALADGAGVFLTGAVGVGKSHAAAGFLAAMLPDAVAPQRQRDGREAYGTPILSARWLGVPMLLCNLRSTFGRDKGPTEAEIVEELTQAHVLVLDDLAAEKVTDWTAATVRLIANTRLDNCLRTIVTSNLTLEEIDGYDPRLASRLGALHYIHLKGRDRRQKGA